MDVNQAKWYLFLQFLLITTINGQQTLTNMKCSYGERGSLTATCVNATASFFRQTAYRFDSLDETLRCINCNLVSIETGTFDISGNQILNLDLSNSKITTLKESSFIGLVFLQNLNLKNNKINGIFPGVFKGIKKLRTLDISNNSITVLAANAFIELVNLQTLNFNKNALKIISAQAFNGLVALKMLDLSENYIQEIGNCLDPLKKLSTLNLNYNMLETLQRGDFTNLTLLDSLELSHNRLKTLQSDTFLGLHNLSTLTLANNQIAIVEMNAFEGLRKLEYISLEHNNITIINKGTFNGLFSLRDLMLGYNSIKNFTTGLFNGLPELRNLNLSHNNLFFIRRTGVLALHSLTSLDVSHNNLTDLDYKLMYMHMPKLTYIELSKNPWPCYLLHELKEYFDLDSIKLIYELESCVDIKKKVNENIYNEMLTEEDATIDKYYAHSYVVYPLLIIVIMINVSLFYLLYRRDRMQYFGQNKSVSHANLVSSELQARDDY